MLSCDAVIQSHVACRHSSGGLGVAPGSGVPGVVGEAVEHLGANTAAARRGARSPPPWKRPRGPVDMAACGCMLSVDGGCLQTAAVGSARPGTLGVDNDASL